MKLVIREDDIDWRLLRQQKQSIRHARNLLPQERDRLDGLLCLLNALQNQAARSFGEVAVYGSMYPEDRV